MGLVLFTVAILSAGAVRAEVVELAGKKYNVPPERIVRKQPTTSLYSLLNRNPGQIYFPSRSGYP